MTSSMNSQSDKQDQSLKRSWVPSPVYHIFRILIALIFIMASIDKIISPANFGRAIYAYQFLTGPFAYLISPMAVIMPWCELVTGILLLVNRMVRPAALIILAMNIVFIIAIISVMMRGIKVECGCGLDVGIIAAIAGTQAGAQALVRDFVILAMNLVVLLAPQSLKK
jgi:putative oxidoreductase